MTHLKYTKHIKRRMAKRKISRRQVEETITSPDHYDWDEYGNERAYKRFGNQVVRVVYHETPTEIRLITVMKLHPDDITYI